MKCLVSLTINNLPILSCCSWWPAFRLTFPYYLVLSLNEDVVADDRSGDTLGADRGAKVEVVAAISGGWWVYLSLSSPMNPVFYHHGHFFSPIQPHQW